MAPPAAPQAASPAEAVIDHFCLAGCPAGAPPSNVLVLHHILELSNNPRTKLADWVAYEITASTLGSGCKRIWMTDPDLDPSTTLSPSDYRGIRAGLASDRGHQAPLASLCGSPYWEEADYLSNITPQKSDLNEGTWEELEKSERQLITDHISDTVFSLTGPLFEREMPRLPESHKEHAIPSGYWKLISIRAGSSIESVAFIMDQDLSRETDFCNQAVPLETLESRSHLKFFPRLDAAAKEKLMHTGLDQNLLRALGC
ncbi:MAG: DNA/RNA non-specific endonuclease [Pseudomonadota bacterium]|nr:DNA/RNA non-specific endonuclease [Pseudomonadota bacterium]